jgi:hypothetical protein
MPGEDSAERLFAALTEAARQFRARRTGDFEDVSE